MKNTKWLSPFLCVVVIVMGYFLFQQHQEIGTLEKDIKLATAYYIGSELIEIEKMENGVGKYTTKQQLRYERMLKDLSLLKSHLTKFDSISFKDYSAFFDSVSIQLAENSNHSRIKLSESDFEDLSVFRKVLLFTKEAEDFNSLQFLDGPGSHLLLSAMDTKAVSVIGVKGETVEVLVTQISEHPFQQNFFSDLSCTNYSWEYVTWNSIKVKIPTESFDMEGIVRKEFELPLGIEYLDVVSGSKQNQSKVVRVQLIDLSK